MIGAGIFALPSALGQRAGILSPWLFLAAGLLIIIVVFSLAELASYFRESGGPALYASEAFGPLVGFSTGWIYYASRAAAVAANMHVMALYLGSLWGWFDTTAGHASVVIAVSLGLTIVNIIGVKGGVRTLSVFTYLKVIPLILLVVIGLRSVNADILLPASLPTIDDLGGTILLLIYAFMGFEQVLITAGETAHPRRTIPRALVRTVAATAVFYFLIMLVYVAVAGDAVGDGGTLVDTGRRLAGPAGALAITLAAVFSIGGNLSGTTLAVPRLTLSLAEQRLLPAWFGAIHPRFISPANSIMFFGGFAVLLGLTGSFVILAVASSLTRLIVFMVCILGLPKIRQKAEVEARAIAFRLPGGYTIPLLAILICAWMASHSTLRDWLYFFALFIVGLALYLLEALILRKKPGAAHEPS